MLWGVLDEVWEGAKIIGEGAKIIAEDVYEGGKIILGYDVDEDGNPIPEHRDEKKVTGF